MEKEKADDVGVHMCRANQSKQKTSVPISVLLLDDDNWQANQSM